METGTVSEAENFVRSIYPSLIIVDRCGYPDRKMFAVYEKNGGVWLGYMYNEKEPEISWKIIQDSINLSMIDKLES